MSRSSVCRVERTRCATADGRESACREWASWRGHCSALRGPGSPAAQILVSDGLKEASCLRRTTECNSFGSWITEILTNYKYLLWCLIFSRDCKLTTTTATNDVNANRNAVFFSQNLGLWSCLLWLLKLKFEIRCETHLRVNINRSKFVFLVVLL